MIFNSFNCLAFLVNKIGMDMLSKWEGIILDSFDFWGGVFLNEQKWFGHIKESGLWCFNNILVLSRRKPEYPEKITVLSHSLLFYSWFLKCVSIEFSSCAQVVCVTFSRILSWLLWSICCWDIFSVWPQFSS